MRALGTHGRAGLLILTLSFASWGGSCPSGTTPNLTGSTTTPTAVLLRIVNSSGVAAEVTATFYASNASVRETTRLLAADGLGATELIVPTTTDRIHVHAGETDRLDAAAKVGDVLADEDITVADDVKPGDVITFVIHSPSFTDCNDNGIDDPDDISGDTSTDCNLNGVPDECDAEVPISVVIGERQRIIKTDADGATPATLVSLPSYGLGSLRKIAVDAEGEGVFFTQTVSVSDGTVERIPLGGGTPVSLISSQDEIGGIGLDVQAGKMYWSSHLSSPAGFRIASADFDGSNATNIITALSGPVPKPLPDPINSRIFFTLNPQAGINDYIQRCDYDGSNVVSLVGNAMDPRDVAAYVTGNLLVWAEYGSGGGVFTADLGALPPVKIVTAPSVTGVAIDRYNCRIYWSVEGTVGLSDGYVERSKFDGTGVVRVLDGLDAPQDVEVFSTP